MILEHFSRNIGLISEKEQLLINQGHVLICGLGGMGGVCAEALVRAGVGNLTLIDHDKFELTNINRQIYSNETNIGKYKVKEVAKNLKKINSKINIRIINKPVSEKNINDLLKNINIVVNAMDELIPSLILERSARSKKITIVDAWLTPYASVFVMSPKSPHWESFLKMRTLGKSIEDITPEDKFLSLKNEIKYTFSHFKPYKKVSKKIVTEVISGKRKRPSFVIVVWMSGLLMANEVLKILMKKKSTDHRGIFIDQYDYKIIKGNKV